MGQTMVSDAVQVTIRRTWKDGCARDGRRCRPEDGETGRDSMDHPERGITNMEMGIHTNQTSKTEIIKDGTRTFPTFCLVFGTLKMRNCNHNDEELTLQDLPERLNRRQYMCFDLSLPERSRSTEVTSRRAKR